MPVRGFAADPPSLPLLLSPLSWAGGVGHAGLPLALGADGDILVVPLEGVSSSHTSSSLLSWR